MFQPKYNITNKIVKNLTDIESLKVKIENAQILPRDELKLLRQALISMVHHSTGIEGNTLSKYEVDKVLQGGKVEADKREIYEVKNYRQALKYISDLAKQDKTASNQAILKIHQLTTKNILNKAESGKFRKSPVYVVRRQFGVVVKILYTGPKAVTVQT